MSDLTPRQRDALDAILVHLDQHGYAPSIRELRDALGLKSTNRVFELLTGLEEKGRIRRGGLGMARSLVVVEGAKPATSIVDMGDGTVHVAATVRLEDVDALVARIRDVAAAAARRSA